MIKAMFRRCSACLLVAAGLVFQAQAELRIEVTQGVDNAVRIAVVPFAWSHRDVLSEDVSGIVTADLRLSGRFDTLPVDQMLSLPANAGEVLFRDWRLQAVEYLLIGSLEKHPEGIAMTFELFDVYRQVSLIRQTVVGTEDELRDLAHYASDVVFEKLTGIPGAFSTRILYVTSLQTDAGRRYRLNVADADGYRVETVLDSKEPILSASWAPDGDRIAYVSFENDRRPAIFIHDLKRRKRQQVTAFSGLNGAPAFSPDGSELAMVLSKDGNPDIYVLNLASRKLRRVTRHYGIDTEPSWSHDGESIVFTSNRGGKPQIYSMRLLDFQIERLTFEGDYNAKASLLRDGRGMVLVHRREGIFHIAYMDLERGRMQVLTDTALDESPSVAPNGAMLIYATLVRGQGILAAVSVDGGIKFNLPSTEGDVREPAWSPRKRREFVPIE